jgi:hypothetical protein
MLHCEMHIAGMRDAAEIQTLNSECGRLYSCETRLALMVDKCRMGARPTRPGDVLMWLIYDCTSSMLEHARPCCRMVAADGCVRRAKPF